MLLLATSPGTIQLNERRLRLEDAEGDCVCDGRIPRGMIVLDWIG